jgi:hypothetical protein
MVAKVYRFTEAQIRTSRVMSHRFHTARYIIMAALRAMTMFVKASRTLAASNSPLISIWRREAMGVGFALRLPSEAGRYYAFP